MFNKKNKLVLTANSPSDGLVDLFPLVKGRLPNFFKNLKKNDLQKETNNNVRVCPGLTDLYSTAISIPAWQDIKITIGPRGMDVDAPQMQWSASSHDLNSQAPGAWPGYVNIKLESPWILQCNKDVKWTMIQPVWDQQMPHEQIVVPGVLEFKYQNQANINLIFPVHNTEKEYKIKAGDIIAMLIPNFDNDYDIVCQYIDKLNVDRILNSRWIFANGPTYPKMRSILRNKNK